LRNHYNHLIPEGYLTYAIDYGSELFIKLFNQFSFDIVAHFAAHKHVRTERDILSVESMITNNVFNTLQLLQLCKERPPEHFFAVSTDKATNPVNIMGASKKLMEMTILSFGELFSVSTARFANVAFSNGSLLDGFLNRITKKQPLSAPVDILRYFVSAEEAGQLCLIGSILSKSGDIVFPLLEKSGMMSFSDIGTSLLNEMGFEIEECATEDEAREKSVLWREGNKYPVFFYKSDTSGEKEEEEFTSADDKVILDEFKKIGVIRGIKNGSIEEVTSNITLLKNGFKKQSFDKAELIRLMEQIVPDFNHFEVGKNLDQRL
jgi:FlaA1/EpsC-like NDP-sugar epimerase